MEWLILVLGVVGVAIVFYLFLKKRKVFDKYKGLIEVCAIIFSVIFAVYQVRSSAEDFEKIVNRMEGIIESAEESKKSLKEVENSLSGLPAQIDSFSVSINLLNKVVIHQRDKLETTLNDFNSSILGFQGSVDDMAKRFDRHPKLKIDLKKTETNSSIKITHIVVTNYGDLLANVYMVRLQIEEEVLDSIKWNNSRETLKQGTLRTFQLDRENVYITPSETKPTLFDCELILTKNPKLLLNIFVYYTSPFGNDGNASESFKLQ
jgi:hypothetical protein